LKKRPTAIFCANDYMAAGAIKAAKEENLSVPKDISIVGFDDQIIAEMSDPPLTTVRQPLYQVGILSARRLFNIIDGKIPTSSQGVLDTKLIVRNSCASQKK
jgi:DNA-binding LacI/PurR family transcriptional regulator